MRRICGCAEAAHLVWPPWGVVEQTHSNVSAYDGIPPEDDGDRTIAEGPLYAPNNLLALASKERVTMWNLLSSSGYKIPLITSIIFRGDYPFGGTSMRRYENANKSAFRRVGSTTERVGACSTNHVYPHIRGLKDEELNLQANQYNRPILIEMLGPPGVGKSAICQEFTNLTSDLFLAPASDGSTAFTKAARLCTSLLKVASVRDYRQVFIKSLMLVRDEPFAVQRKIFRHLLADFYRIDASLNGAVNFAFLEEGPLKPVGPYLVDDLKKDKVLDILDYSCMPKMFVLCHAPVEVVVKRNIERTKRVGAAGGSLEDLRERLSRSLSVWGEVAQMLRASGYPVLEVNTVESPILNARRIMEWDAIKLF